MHCDDVRRELEGSLVASARSAAVRQHLVACHDCRVHAEHLEAVELALREAGATAPAVDERAFVEAVLARLPAAAPRRSVRWWPLAAAAAAVLAAATLFLLRPWARRETTPETEPEPRVVVTLLEPTTLLAGRVEPVMTGSVGPSLAAPPPDAEELAELPPLF